MTDNKPIISAFKTQKCLNSDRQQRHLSFISEYVNDIVHIRGNQNVVADCLSRPTINAINLDVCDLTEIANSQINDSEIDNYKNKLKIFSLKNNFKILCDTSCAYPRPFVSQELRKSVFDSLHNLSHPGIKGTTKLIKQRYFWPNMDRSIKLLCNECTNCQQSKINRHTHSEVSSFELPSSRFQTVHIDLVGPLPSVTNNNDPYLSPFRYLLTCIDRNTRWVEACPLTEISAAVVAQAFIDIWISRFGVPLHIITDRGSQFESELFLYLSKVIGFHRLRTTAYHPQSNGMIERCHRTIKTAIIARKETWLSALPIVLLGIRNVPNESGYSPFTAVTGTKGLLPQLLIDDDDHNNVNMNLNQSKINELVNEMKKIDLSELSNSHIHSRPKSYIPKDLKHCEYVWLRTDRVRRSLEAPYTGPYKVLSRNDKHFCIQLSESINSNVSIDRLKPAKIPLVLDNIESERVDNQVSDENSQSLGSPNIIEPEPVKTRSGRTVKFSRNNLYHYF